jgi:NADH-quinone oxidoreductase subunit G
MEFDDPYSLNTVDICPVGALTSTDFRFKARVWEMNQTPSIDITGAKGTNIDIWTRDNLVLRITPRFNKEVNDHWMPDVGREAYRLFNENRVDRPSLKLDGDNQAKTSWSNALQTLAEHLEGRKPKDVLVLGSPHASVEENYALMRFFNLWGVNDIHYVEHIIEGAGDNLLLTDDQAPNTAGCELLGMKKLSSDELKEATKDAKTVILLSDHLIDRGVLDAKDLSRKFKVVFASNHSETTAKADLLIPVTCIAEHAASYVNIDGRIQRSIAAKETLYSNRSLDLEMSQGRLDRYGTNFDNWVSEENKVDCKPLWETLTDLAEVMSLDITFGTSREIMAEIAKTIPAFEGVNYLRMDEEKGIVLRKAGAQEATA